MSELPSKIYCDNMNKWTLAPLPQEGRVNEYFSKDIADKLANVLIERRKSDDK